MAGRGPACPFTGGDERVSLRALSSGQGQEAARAGARELAMTTVRHTDTKSKQVTGQDGLRERGL